MVEIIGWVGMGIIMLAYILTSNGFIAANHVAILLTNICGSTLFGIHLLMKGSWSGVSLQLLWIAISLIAMVKVYYGRNRIARTSH